MDRQDITVLVRTRNEEHRIAKFCEAYKDVDRILVADGGSEDRTIEIARQYKNAIVRHYPVLNEMANGYKRNPDGPHVNWLIEWSKEYKTDWVILDDCDCIPNALLKREYRKILSEVTEDYVMVTRIYMWGKDQHFPNLAKPGDGHEKWEPSLWAWRGNQDFWMVDVPPAFTFRIGDLDVKDLHFDAKAFDLFPPYCLLHQSWDDPDRVELKVKTYRESGLIPNMLHPLFFGGHLESLESWMVE